MKSPERNQQKGNGSKSQQNEDGFHHDESSSARGRSIHSGGVLSSKAIKPPAHHCARQHEPTGRLSLAQPCLRRSELLQSILNHSEVLKYKISSLSRAVARSGLEGFEQIAPELSHILQNSPVFRTHISGNDRLNACWHEMTPNIQF